MKRRPGTSGSQAAPGSGPWIATPIAGYVYNVSNFRALVTLSEVLGAVLIWFLIGGVTLVFGLIAAFLYRVEDDEPERTCPRCGQMQKLYVQVCRRCGLDLYLPEPDEVRHPPPTGTTPRL